jgi:hypothetical protein
MKTTEQKAIEDNTAIIAQGEWNENQLEKIVAYSEDVNERINAAIALGASRMANALLRAKSRSSSQRITGRDRISCLAKTAWKFREKYARGTDKAVA